MNSIDHNREMSQDHLADDIVSQQRGWISKIRSAQRAAATHDNTPQAAATRLLEGWTAAERGLPFCDWESRGWKDGWELWHQKHPSPRMWGYVQ